MKVLDAKGAQIRPGMAVKDRFGIVHEVVSIESPVACRTPVVILNGKRRKQAAGSALEVMR